jgi:hypothetical protein
MKTSSIHPVTALWLVIGAIALMLGGAGCHSDAPSTPMPLPAGVAPIDSSKPPPDMQGLRDRTHPAPASAH